MKLHTYHGCVQDPRVLHQTRLKLGGRDLPPSDFNNLLRVTEVSSDADNTAWQERGRIYLCPVEYIPLATVADANVASPQPTTVDSIFGGCRLREIAQHQRRAADKYLAGLALAIYLVTVLVNDTVRDFPDQKAFWSSK